MDKIAQHITQTRNGSQRTDAMPEVFMEAIGQQIHNQVDYALMQCNSIIEQKNKEIQRLNGVIQEKDDLIKKLLEIIKEQDKIDGATQIQAIETTNTSITAPADKTEVQDIVCPEELKGVLCNPEDYGDLKMRSQSIKDKFRNDADLAIYEQVLAQHGVIQSCHKHRDFLLLMKNWGVIGNLTQAELKKKARGMVNKISNIRNGSGILKEFQERYKGWKNSDDIRKAKAFAEVLPKKYPYAA